MKKRTYIKDLSKNIGEEVVVKGWVNSCRKQGKMIFLDIRDASGLVQGIILPKSEAIEVGQSLRDEFVVEVGGRVNERPDNQKKTDVLNGTIELEVLSLVILNETEVLPFQINEDTRVVNEQLRLKHRYLDLRSERMNKNIINRSKVQNFIRSYLIKDNFVEVDTPLLSAPTPEGSRSHVVPSRLSLGNFFSLPQSPQQYKQLLMVAGLERYFQFPHCMRDEDARGDRQPEFTQLDLEMSFTSEEEVMQLSENMLIEIVKNFYPEKRIQQIPFPKMSYKEAMEKYGTDRPDIREDKEDDNLLAFLWVVDFPMFEKTDEDNVDGTGDWTFTHNPFSKPKESSFAQFMNKEDIANIITTQYDVVLNGFEIGGGSLRNHKAEALRTTFEIMGYSEKRIDKSFGHILQALKLGAPPHGGIAWGFDRLLMVLENEPSIREVIPFSKMSDGKDPLMNAPSEITEKELDELGIEIKKKNK